MIVFLDTSAFLKLYVAEEDSETIHSLVQSDVDVAVSSVSYVEMHSALARRWREGSIKSRDLARVTGAFEADWFQFSKIHVDDDILRKAGKLCLKHPLRSLDAIQLAAALFVSQNREEPFVFLTYDERLKAAARQEKLQSWI